MIAFARCETSSMARRLSSTILAWNFGEASAASAYGEPPALFTTTSSRPCRSAMESIIRATDVLVADIAAVELVRQPVHRAARAGDDRRALLGEHLADAGANPSYTAGHQDDPAVSVPD